MKVLETPRIHPNQLSYELRETTEPDLQRRRWIVGLSFASMLLAKLFISLG